MGTRHEAPRVLVVHNAYQQRGGEDRVVEDEIDLLRNHGHEVQHYSKHNRSIDAQAKIPLFFNTLWSRDSAREIRAVIRAFMPDVIHVHNTFPLISASIYWQAASERIPVIQTLHNFRLLCAQAMFLRDDVICEDCIGKYPWRGVLHKCYRGSMPQSAAAVTMIGLHRSIGTFRNKVTRYIALSEFAKAKFVESGQLAEDQLVVKPNFVDIELAGESAQRRGGLFVGRLSREKGIHVLAAAANELETCHINVIGTGPELAAYEDTENLHFLGWREKQFVSDRMRAARYLVLPSICYENFPRTLVEAFACGLPVIASRLGALPELIEDGYNGLVFAPGSGKDLASKIAWADAHADLMVEMGRNARATYQARYTAAKNYTELIQIYSDAIDAFNRVPESLAASEGT